MRFVVGSVVLLWTAQAATAADLPYLRGSNPYEPGSPAYFSWGGFYAGGHVGKTFGSFDFTEAIGPLVGFILRESEIESQFSPSQWKMLGKEGGSSTHFGGFVGYNSQWEDVILGVEVGYSRVSASAAASDSIGRALTLSDNFRYDLTIDSAAAVRVTDYATLRGRAGYVIGPLLPYVTAGVAVGRASYVKTASVSYPTPVCTLPPSIDNPQPCGPVPPPFGPVTRTESKNDGIFFGYAAGVGLDVAVLPNVFVRGEYEWAMLPNVGGIAVTLNNVRVGAGVRF
jgi:opacity protein-like surface antigen